jgi:hypothetical protein
MHHIPAIHIAIQKNESIVQSRPLWWTKEHVPTTARDVGVFAEIRS